MADTDSLIQAGESETVEFKETWRDSDALRELAAFANTRGGTLLVGVADDGSVVGWHGDGDDLDALTNKIADRLRLHPTVMCVETVQSLPQTRSGGENVLRIEVAPSTVPISYRGRYFQRVGRTAREVPPDELPRFLMQRTSITWDALPAGMPLDAISREHLSRFIRSANTRLPQADASEDPAQLLGKLDLLTDDDPTRAAVLLFGVKPQALVFAAHIRMGRFKDDITIVDETAIKGTLFEQFDAVMQRFRQYLQVRYEIPTEAGEREGLEMVRRREVWEYPLEALREAVVNALVHRHGSAHTGLSAARPAGAGVRGIAAAIRGHVPKGGPYGRAPARLGTQRAAGAGRAPCPRARQHRQQRIAAPHRSDQAYGLP